MDRKGLRAGAWGLALSVLAAVFTGCLGSGGESTAPIASHLSVEQSGTSQLPIESSASSAETPPLVESSIPPVEPEPESTQTSVVLEFYTAMEENEIYPYTLTEKAKAMLEEHEDLFLDNRIDGCEENTDYAIEHRALDKNIDRYGDKLFYLPDALVLQIAETDVNEETTITEMLVCNEDMRFYLIVSLCGYGDIYQEDVVNIYALPLAKSGFDNVSGGTTLVVVAAAAHIEKASE